MRPAIDGKDQSAQQQRRRGPAAPDEARDEPASGFSASGFSAAEEARRRAERMRRDDEGRRASSNIEAAVLLAEMVRAELKTICFCSVRKICELVLDYARQHLRAELGIQSPHAPSLLGAYRGGLTPADRRRVEAQLYDGTLRGVTATSSLELGVDIANLDGVIMLGFPGSLASLWQRAGRCGR
jgi:DEAD/DEAH box helicase domain-containing protein